MEQIDLTGKPPPDLRCDDCVVIGCECPQGYVVESMSCNVCAYRFVLTRPGCALRYHVLCPECGGSVDEVGA